MGNAQRRRVNHAGGPPTGVQQHQRVRKMIAGLAALACTLRRRLDVIANALGVTVFEMFAAIDPMRP